jgi:hypothetical protein
MEYNELKRPPQEGLIAAEKIIRKISSEILNQLP